MTADKFGASDAAVPSTPAKPSFWARLKAHYKRFWWAHLIALIIVVLVVVLPVVYVGYPNIAQEDVHESGLEVEKIQITDPAPESFHLNQTQILKTDSIFHPHFFAFNATASLAGSDTPFALVEIPPITANDGTIINVNQQVDLSNDSHAAAFAEFSTATMLQEEVVLNLYGRPQLKQGELPTITVTYNKTVPIKGLNGLKGFNVTEFDIDLGKSSGTNMNGTVFIPNPSVLTITMGNLTLDLSVDGEHVGQSFLTDFVLHPGDNYFPMTSKVDQFKVVTMIGDKYSDGLVPFDITGNSSVYHGKELPYFTKALKANTMSTKLNIKSALPAK